jgi:hypothetical protein
VSDVSSNAPIPIVYIDDRPNGEKGLFSAAQSLSTKIGVIRSGDLAANLSSVCSHLAEVFQSAQRATGGFALDEFEVTLELTAGGEVRLIGSASTEFRGGIKLVFRRPAGQP